MICEGCWADNCEDKCQCKCHKIVYPQYNNCGNCTHSFLERIWHWQSHRRRID